MSVPDPKLPGGPDSDPDPQHETHLGGGSAGSLSSVYAFSRVIHPSYYALGPSTMHQNMEIFKHVNRPVPKTTIQTGRAQVQVSLSREYTGPLATLAQPWNTGSNGRV